MSARGIARDADLYADELVADTPDSGATVLVARMSRYFVDLNRREDDHDRYAVEGSAGYESPHGVIWHRATDGERALVAPLPEAEVERRLALVYRPYHQALRALLEEKKRRFGHAILVCAHTMPSAGLSFGGRETARADVVPGSRGRTSAAGAVIDAVDRHARSFNFSVRHDDPYRGAFSTQNYGTPARGFHAIQIEIARRLYMNEQTLQRLPRGIGLLRRFYRDLIPHLAALDPRPPRLR